MTDAIEQWIEREFAGYGVAIRCKGDDPVSGEPFMSMAEAKELARRAVAEFASRASEPAAWQKRWRADPATGWKHVEPHHVEAVQGQGWEVRALYAGSLPKPLDRGHWGDQ